MTCSFLTQQNPPILTSFIVPEYWAKLTDEQFFNDRRFAKNQTAKLFAEGEARRQPAAGFSERWAATLAQREKDAQQYPEYREYLDTMAAYKFAPFEFDGWKNVYSAGAKYR